MVAPTRPHVGAVGLALLLLALPACAVPDFRRRPGPPVEVEPVADAPTTVAAGDPNLSQPDREPRPAESGDANGPQVDLTPSPPDPPPGTLDRLYDGLGRELTDVRDDYLHYYSAPNLGRLALGVALAAPLANTAADRHVRNWYQDDVRSHDTDNAAAVAKGFGEYAYTLPAFAGVTLLGALTDDTAAGRVELEWGSRSLRAMAVGAPPVGLLQIALGPARPTHGDSRWQPFRSSHGVSGHAFVGAVPFLTAAEMSDDLWLKSVFVAGSFAAGWSRVNDDAHYLSQAALGWWLAYLAVHSVGETDGDRKRWAVAPTWSTGGPGVAVYGEY